MAGVKSRPEAVEKLEDRIVIDFIYVTELPPPSGGRKIGPVFPQEIPSCGIRPRLLLREDK
jgi:hypothetical protein